MTARQIYYALSPRMRLLARRLFYLPIDMLEGISGKRDTLTPPRGMIFVGSGDFKAQGQIMLAQLVTLAGLQPHEQVLDVGSGIGRVAVPLTQYLNKAGSYEGIDIVRTGVDWCQRKISRVHANFRFTHIDLKNDLYNLSTEQEAKGFVFPYTDNRFDVVFLFSVFTHMMPDDTANYLQQIARVMKPGGRCLATFFLLTAHLILSLTAQVTVSIYFALGVHGTCGTIWETSDFSIARI
jgi:SAM-dependent methyltransferase